jgi:spermidine/putrescine transport system permease protein
MRSKQADPAALRLGALATFDWFLVAALFITPLVFIITRSFGQSNPVTLDVELIGTIDSYRALFSPLYRPVLVRSAVLSALTVVLCICIGLPAALAVSRLSPRWRSVALFAVMLPSFVSFAVRIFAWQGVLATGGPIESITGWRLLFQPAAVLIGMTTAYVPLFFLPAFVSLSRVPVELVQAAADLGSSPTRRTWTIVLPLARSGVIAGVALVAVLSIGEFIVPTVLGGGKVLLLGTILAERGAGSDQPLGGAITATVIIACSAVGLTARAIARWRPGAS